MDRILGKSWTVPESHLRPWKSLLLAGPSGVLHTHRHLAATFLTTRRNPERCAVVESR